MELEAVALALVALCTGPTLIQASRARLALD
jgi:hypothetical protein